MISVEEARGRIWANGKSDPAEVVALAEAWNRVTAEGVAARLTQPPLTSRRWMAMRCARRTVRCMPRCG